MVAIGNLLNTAGGWSNNNGINTMATSAIGFIRAGTVPFDRKATKQEKAQNITWNLTTPIVSILIQLGIYTGLKPILRNISLKNLKLEEIGKELKNLEKMPLDNIEDTLRKAKNPKGSYWARLQNEIRNSPELKVKPSFFRKIIAKSLGIKTPKIIDHSNSVIESLENLTKKTLKTAKKPTEKQAKKLLETLKTYKGGNEILNFAYGVVFSVGYMMPLIVMKYMNPMLKLAHDKIEVKGKSIIPEPKKREIEDKSSAFKFFGIPIAVAGATLFALSRKSLINLKIGKKTVHKWFKGLAEKEKKMRPAGIIKRNIFSNMIVRPGVALLNGRFDLAGYIFVTEAMSLLSVTPLRKVLGTAKEGTGWVGKIINKIDAKTVKKIPLDASQRKGVEFLVSHLILSYAVLGIGLGLLSNIVSDPVAHFFKKIFKNKDKNDNTSDEFERFVNILPTISLKDDMDKFNQISSINLSNAPVLKPAFLSISNTGKINQLQNKYKFEYLKNHS